MTYQFYALTSSVRIDGKTEEDEDQWIRLSEINDNLQLGNPTPVNQTRHPSRHVSMLNT